MELPRKQLAELMILYELEPKLRDVFVEGSFDLGIIRWFLNRKNIENIGIYEIGAVEMPDGEILSRGRKANNHGRLVLLAEYAERLLGTGQKQITCIVDRDFSSFLENTANIACLLYTDYSCMEMYVFNKSTLRKFLTIYCSKGDWPIEEIMAGISDVLQELFLYRLANEALGWEMAFLDGQPCMTVREWSIDFDATDFLHRYLNKNSKMSDVEVFSQSISTFRDKLTPDVRNQSHGHDFVEVFCWFLRQNGVRANVANAKIVGRVLALCLEDDQLAGVPMFESLLQRVMS